MSSVSCDHYDCRRGPHPETVVLPSPAEVERWFAAQLGLIPASTTVTLRP